MLPRYTTPYGVTRQQRVNVGCLVQSNISELVCLMIHHTTPNNQIFLDFMSQDFLLKQGRRNSSPTIYMNRIKCGRKSTKISPSYNTQNGRYSTALLQPVGSVSVYKMLYSRMTQDFIPKAPISYCNIYLVGGIYFCFSSHNPRLSNYWLFHSLHAQHKQ